MPSPSTTNLPRPKSWDEFEDICADVLKCLWQDPYITRNGRSGQKQHGVDIYGLPQHLGGATSGKYAAAQCKETDTLTIDVVEAEIQKATTFKPTLTEYLLMTTAPRDSGLQEAIRTKTWPFGRVQILFWDDISLELSGHDDLLQKHFPGWMRKTTTKEQVLNMVLSARPEEFDYDDNTGVSVCQRDVQLRVIQERGPESDDDFDEPWVRKFPDPKGKRQPVYIHYGETRVTDVYCVSVDGGRHLIPVPKSTSELTINPFQYHVGCILNHPIKGYGFDHALKMAGITVADTPADAVITQSLARFEKRAGVYSVSVSGSCFWDRNHESGLGFKVTNTGKEPLPPFKIAFFHPKIGTWFMFSSDKTDALLPHQERQFRCQMTKNGAIDRAFYRLLFDHTTGEPLGPGDEPGFEFRLVLVDSEKVLYTNKRIGRGLATVIRLTVEAGHVGSGPAAPWAELSSELPDV